DRVSAGADLRAHVRGDLRATAGRALAAATALAAAALAAVAAARRALAAAARRALIAPAGGALAAAATLAAAVAAARRALTAALAAVARVGHDRHEAVPVQRDRVAARGRVVGDRQPRVGVDPAALRREADRHRARLPDLDRRRDAGAAVDL